MARKQQAVLAFNPRFFAGPDLLEEADVRTACRERHAKARAGKWGENEARAIRLDAETVLNWSFG